ncbi:MAG TPA: ATP-binding protein [Methylococcaceae bacterium]|nr:ATP-binding protein [Methylococcaceae bacterium]
MLITANRSAGEWGGMFGDPVVATAVLDRLLHHSTVIAIPGDSYWFLSTQQKPRRNERGRFFSSPRGDNPRFA